MGRPKKNKVIKKEKKKEKIKGRGRPKINDKNNEKVKEDRKENIEKPTREDKTKEYDEDNKNKDKDNKEYKEYKQYKDNKEHKNKGNKQKQENTGKKRGRKPGFKKIKSEEDFIYIDDNAREDKSTLDTHNEYTTTFDNKLDKNIKELKYKGDKENELRNIEDENKQFKYNEHTFKDLKKEQDNTKQVKYNEHKSIDVKQEVNLFDSYDEDEKDITPIKLENIDVKLENTYKNKIKNNIMSILELSCNLPFYKMIGDYFEEKSVLRTAESIILFCHKLNLSLPTLLTALVYLQLYNNSSRNWRSSKQYNIIIKNVKRRKFLKWDEQYLTSAACVLLAWKYKEDEIGLVKSTKKLFDLSITLYKIIVSQSSRKTQNLSVSSWMLQDSGEEIKTLKSQIVDRENQILHALDYFIGPIPLPDSLISPYVKLFLISMTDDFTEHHSYAKKLEDVVSLLVLDFYKTQMCIDYTPNEIVAISIIKASCLLAFINPNDDICKYNLETGEFKDTALNVENKLNKFISSLGDNGLQVNRIVSGLLQIQKYSKIFKHSMTLKESS